jgi:hypothetical protein
MERTTRNELYNWKSFRAYLHSVKKRNSSYCTISTFGCEEKGGFVQFQQVVDHNHPNSRFSALDAYEKYMLCNVGRCSDTHEGSAHDLVGILAKSRRCFSTV